MRTGQGDPNTEEAWVMQAWNAVLDDETDEKDKMEDLGGNTEQSDKTEVLTDTFGTRFDVIVTIADEKEKETAAVVVESTWMTSRKLFRTSQKSDTYQRKKWSKRRYSP